MDGTTTDVLAPQRGIPWRLVGLALLPLVLLVAFLALLVSRGSGLRPSDAPPLEALTVQRVTLPAPGRMAVQVANGGPTAVTIAQVAVDDAYWQFHAEPGTTVPRLGTATLTLDYPWVAGEPHEVMLVSSTGVTFSGAVDVALAAPARDLSTLWQFLLLGFYVGVVPVALGLLWYPVVKRLGTRGLAFILSLTVGLLAFLFIDTLLEALEVAARLPDGYHATPLVWLVAILTVGVVEGTGAVRRRGRSALGVAALIAFGIGLHNFGEGLAIGAAYTLGELALGAFLVIGFTLHNVTEGLAVAAPLARAAPKLRHFVALALLAGAPAMLGTWFGAFAYSEVGATVFLAIGAGAIAQVVYSVSRYTVGLLARDGHPALSPVTVGGFAAGVALMFATALAVAA